RGELEQTAARLGLRERVTFHGFQPETDSWYRRADLFLFPAKLENSPLVLLEAMSYAVPCLALKADGIHYRNANAEVIRHGVNGLLAEGESDFQVQLRSALEDPAALGGLGLAARAVVEQKH